jgi:hypothetical protein
VDWSSGTAEIVFVVVVVHILPLLFLLFLLFLPFLLFLLFLLFDLLLYEVFVLFVAESRKINQPIRSLFIKTIKYNDGNTFVFFAALDGDVPWTRFFVNGGAFFRGFSRGFLRALFRGFIVSVGKEARGLTVVRALAWIMGVPLCAPVDLVSMLLLTLSPRCCRARKGGPHYILWNIVV